MLGIRSGKNEVINEAPIEETHESESSDEGSLTSSYKENSDEDYDDDKPRQLHRAPTIKIDSNWGDKAVSKTLNEPERKLKDTGGPPSDSCSENIQSDVSEEEQKIDTAGLEDMSKQKKRLDYRSKTVTFSIDSNKEEEKQDLLKEKKKVVHEVKIHDQMMILFGSILLQCNQFEAAIKVLEEIGLDSCSDRLTHANVLRLICLTFLNDSGDSIYTARSYCERAITKNDQVKCIKGLAICHLLRLHILLKINKKENPDYSAEGGCRAEDLEFKTNKNNIGLENLDSISADKIKRTFSQWKTRMKQLTEFDDLPLYKSIFDHVKSYEDHLLDLKLDEGEIAEKVMKFWMIPIINTSKEKYTEFEIKRESSNRLQLVLEHHHSAGLQMKPFEVDLNFDIETREALGLDNISELERRDKPSIKSIKIDKLMQLVSNSIYKKLDKEGPKEVTEKTSVSKSDASVQVDTPKALTPLSQPPSIDRFLNPSKYDQILASPKNEKYSTFSEVELQQYRTVDNFERRAMLTISNPASMYKESPDQSSPGLVSGKFDKHMKYVRKSFRDNYNFVKSNKVAPLRPSRSRQTSGESRDNYESTASLLEENHRKLASSRVNFNLTTPIKFQKYRY